jgi:hypothetical protein
MDGAQAAAKPPGSAVRTLGKATRVGGCFVLFGLGIYLLAVNTTLSLRAGTCCFVALILAVGVVRWLGRDTDEGGIGVVCVSAAALAVSLCELALTYGQQRHWNSGGLHALNTVTDWVLIPVSLCVATVMLLMEWPAARRWLMKPFARG